MIDQAYQSEIDKNLDDQQRRTEGVKPPSLGTWANASAGFGGFIAGPLQGIAGWADIAKGSSEVMGATEVNGGGGMFSVPSATEQKQIDAAHDKMMNVGVDFDSATGTALRTRAKDFMPDPQSTGKAGQIIGGLTNFAGQAVPAALAGPTGLVALGGARGMQKAEDLKEQGVDPATRMAAGIASGTLDAASMVLPMTGSTRLIAAGKGAAGGVATGIVQTEAEKLLLEHGGYDKLASTYDPFDPVSIALSALVPAGFGLLHAPVAAKPPGAARAEPTRADVTLSPEEQAHSDAVEASTIDVDIASLQKEIAGQTDAGSKQVLQVELDKLTARKAAGVRGAPPLDPNVEAAARVRQTADALDAARLSPDDDIVGHEQHQQAVEAASDQLARGTPVEVSDILGDPQANFERWFGESKILDEQGNPRVMFHGTAQDFDSFRARQADAIFVGDHPIIAEAYANQSAKWMAEHGKDGAPSIAPLFVKADHPFDYENPQHVSALAQRLLGSTEGEKSVMRAKIERLLSEGDWDLIESPETQTAIKALGHDAFYVNESGLKNLGLYDARNLKSAIGNSGRFDPASGSLTDPIGAFGRGVEEYRAAQLPEVAPIKPNHAAFHEALAEAEASRAGAGPHETPATLAAKSAPAPEGSAAHPGPDGVHLDAATDSLLRDNPDLMIDVGEDGKQVRAADYLESVRREAAEKGADATLLEVAARCAIS